MKIVVVGGGGHVGFPLCLVLAQAGHEVTAYDISVEAVDIINSGVLPFKEADAESLLAEVLANGSLKATTSPDSIKSAEAVIVVIGTPVDEYLNPDPEFVINTIMLLKPYLRADQILLLRSTIFPGVSQRLQNFLDAEIPGISFGYCPERIVQGQALKELTTLPQIIGARSEFDYSRAEAIFQTLGIKSIHASPEEAELAKLFTNVWRYIKFAIANQFFMMSNDLSIDYERVREIISFEYPRANDLPKSGFAAGPCLFKDTMQLSALVQQKFSLGQSAMMVNEGMPGYLVSRLEQIYDLPTMTVGILGMAFKGDNDDTRSSLAFKLRKLLAFKSKNVIFSDPFVKDHRLRTEEEVIREADIIIIGAPHSAYKSLITSKPIIDIWGIMGKGVLV
jgi:UDP-N-acetyl-D-mannosaminuronic acid dehydrogenase